MKNKALIIIPLILILLTSCYAAEVFNSTNGKTEIEIYVIYKDSKKPLQGAKVIVDGKRYTTDKNGKMLFTNLKGNERANISVSYTSSGLTASPMITKTFSIKARKDKLTRYTVRFKK